MIRRDFSQITRKLCQLQHKTLPPRSPHIEFVQLKPNNSFKQIRYLVKHEVVLPKQKMIHIQF